MLYKNIMVAGIGVLGSQIAFQIAFKGFQVSVYDINDEALDSGKNKIVVLMERYQEDLGATRKEVNAAFQRISFSCSLLKAVSEADLVIEAIPEVVNIKTKFYTELSKVAPEKTIFLTNSSVLLPSQFAEVTGRPEKFLALHFANEIWINNTAEIMKHPGTNMKVFDDVITFAKDIGMIALPLYKEQPGYILNSLLGPFLEAAMLLWLNKVADPQTIDKAWMKATSSPLGPFAILDIIGITTSYNIELAKASETGDQQLKKMANLLKTELIDKGKLGKLTGEGFYKYPNPKYMNSSFLKG
ncbi:3-hydroxybutyryl-CoA dehydrogenase [Gracilibacillus orientalis]|uniref:3-hydroxybutyryl-CoA dehydrogenase n=1 Tax=Gracilibacillus orientalis TaxID=334253 RepID=A0A1I4L6R8_9BACI|nr:3-hydroxyacyl-CoA dehydrogenase [Gracilibacillus orientalis]SFL86347.1 3-hydroxybutyryl-CoA dehydrogenase [Gracilibacillus orientalis]